MKKDKLRMLTLLKAAVLVSFSLIVFVFGFVVLTKYPVPLASAQNVNVHKVLQKIFKRSFRSVCGAPGNNKARCHSRVVTDDAGSPLGNTSPYTSSYGPVQFHSAYNLPCTPGGTIQAACNTPAVFGGQTIAIVDAYHAPKIESDLNTYSNYYGIPQCTKANGCLTVVNQNGGTTLPTTINSGWALETSLDVEVAHMVCQTCKILLVEANSNSYANLGTAVNTAAAMGATEISNSYGGPEWSGQTSYDTYFNHPGIALTASSGDNGYGPEFPAASPNVVAVGGTTLQLNTDNTYGTETVWNGAGSGCSAYESATAWQKNLNNWSQTNCGLKRAIADVSADADPNTGAAVFDSTSYNGSTGWFQIGGTSLASPLIAGMYALAGGVPANTNAASLPYANFTSTNSYDIIGGNNGSCGTIMCTAGTGYDGPSGLGSGNGYIGFMQVSGTPTPTSIPTPTPTSPPSGQTFTFGFSSIGSSTDFFDQNYIKGSRYKTGSSGGTLKSISAYVASVANAPYNQYQVAIYSDNAGKPGTLLAKSAGGTLKANSWNTLSLTISLQANTYYWLVYNTNSSNSLRNNLKFTNTATKMGVYSTSHVTFGTWPQTFAATLDGYQFSLYATYTSP